MIFKKHKRPTSKGESLPLYEASASILHFGKAKNYSLALTKRSEGSDLHHYTKYRKSWSKTPGRKTAQDKRTKRGQKCKSLSALILFILLFINSLNKTNTDNFVRLIGLEPTQLALLDPKSSASTNFATGACGEGSPQIK